MLQIAFYIESILLIEVRKLLVPLMLGNVEFVAEEWPDTAQLQDTFAAIHDRNFVPAHKLFPCLLVRCAKRWALPSRVRSVIQIDGFFPQGFRNLFECRAFLAAEEKHGVTVTDNGFCGIFVDGFQLALRLQDDGCRDLTATDGGDQLIKLRDQTDVRKLIEQQPYMIL